MSDTVRKHGDSPKLSANGKSQDFHSGSDCNPEQFYEDPLLNIQNEFGPPAKKRGVLNQQKKVVELTLLNDEPPKSPEKPADPKPQPAPIPAAVSTGPKVVPIGSSWTLRLSKSGGKKSPAKKHLLNAIIPLRHAPEFAGALRYNSSALVVVVERAMPWEKNSAEFQPRPWSDHDSLHYTEWLQKHNIDVNSRLAADAAVTVAQDNEFHPIREYFDSLKWDGKPRLDRWLAVYLRAEDSEYSRMIGPKFLISAVARTYKPGEKADCVLMLIGEQGQKKSTALVVLVGKDWFTDEIGYLGSKDSCIALAGKLLVEFSDLDSFTGRSADELKAFISRRIDRYRAPYGRLAEDHPRQTIFCGTTNSETPLTDFTGNRRYWPINVGEADIESLQRDRDQLWAETVHRYKNGANWYLDTPDERDLAAREVEVYREPDDWESLIAKFVAKKSQVTILEIMDQLFDIEDKAVTRSHQIRIGRCLRALGWRTLRPKIIGDGPRPPRVYYPKNKPFG